MLPLLPGPIPGLPLTLPTFIPTVWGHTALTPLQLLAAAASRAPPAGSTTPATLPPVAGLGQPSLSQPGTYHPAATLPPKVVKRILDLEFVEMSEISIDDIPTHTPGHPPLPARPPILDVSMWTEKFCSMAAVLSTRFPEKAPEFFAYLASILRADRNFDDGRWVAYDRCYHREALAQKNLEVSPKRPPLQRGVHREGSGSPPVQLLLTGAPRRPVLSAQPEPAVVWVAPPWARQSRAGTQSSAAPSGPTASRTLQAV